MKIFLKFKIKKILKEIKLFLLNFKINFRKTLINKIVSKLFQIKIILLQNHKNKSKVIINNSLK